MSRYPDPKPVTHRVLSTAGLTECERVLKYYPAHTPDQVVAMAYAAIGERLWTVETTWDYSFQVPTTAPVSTAITGLISALSNFANNRNR